jgi:hypothetical protein
MNSAFANFGEPLPTGVEADLRKEYAKELAEERGEQGRREREETERNRQRLAGLAEAERVDERKLARDR